jgi:hypothetical protein
MTLYFNQLLRFLWVVKVMGDDMMGTDKDS